MLTVAIIGAGVMARNFALRAKELNIHTLCFAWEKGAIAKEYVDEFFDIDIFKTEKIIKICAEKKAAGVLATTELTVRVAGLVADELKLNNNPLDVASNITNKDWVREKGKNFKFLKQPNFKFVNYEEDIKIDKFPVIVKPVSFGGKHGITVVNTQEELSNAIDYAKETIKNRNNDGILIEQFLDQGVEYSVETLSFHKEHNVIQITQKDSSGPPHCVELGHHQPALLSKEMKDKVVNAIIDMLDCIGVENGPCHIEIKIIEKDIYLIEINARPGGDFIAYPLTELSSGYKYLTGIIFTACDIKYDPKTYLSSRGGYTGVYFITRQTKKLKPIFDNCEDKPWLYKKTKVSEELQEITHNDAYHLNSIIYYSDKYINLWDKVND